MDKDSYEKGFQDGHKCCAYEKEKLLAENARYREALNNIVLHGVCAEKCGYHVVEAREALKGE